MRKKVFLIYIRLISHFKTIHMSSQVRSSHVMWSVSTHNKHKYKLSEFKESSLQGRSMCVVNVVICCIVSMNRQWQHRKSDTSGSELEFLQSKNLWRNHLANKTQAVPLGRGNIVHTMLNSGEKEPRINLLFWRYDSVSDVWGQSILLWLGENELVHNAFCRKCKMEYICLLLSREPFKKYEEKVTLYCFHSDSTCSVELQGFRIQLRNAKFRLEEL